MFTLLSYYTISINILILAMLLLCELLSCKRIYLNKRTFNFTNVDRITTLFGFNNSEKHDDKD